MKKILILSCGGTIIMKKNKNGALFPYYDGNKLLSKVPELSEIANFQVENITNVDSTNISVATWTLLAKKIKESYGKYDGFLVTHGTDTMAYSVSALSFALTNINKPIVFTGSQKPLDDLTSDGRNNLLNSALVSVMGFSEICIVFGSKILRGNRSTKVSESSLDAFDSPMVPPLGEITLAPKLFSYTSINLINKNLEIKPKFEKKVIVISLHPDIPLVFLKKIFKTGCRGVILKAYGAGNIPDHILPFLKEAKKLEMPVVILSQCNKGITQMQMYQVGFQALEAGAIPGRDMTLEAAVTKLMWGLANIKNFNQIRKLFDRDLAGEVTITS